MFENKFKGMPFEKCWHCKHKVSAEFGEKNPVTKKKGLKHGCKFFETVLNEAWPKCAGTKFESKTNQAGEPLEVIKTDKIERGEELNQMHWNDVRALAKSYGISLQVMPNQTSGDKSPELEDDDKRIKRRFATKVELINNIIAHEQQLQSQGN
jgi:hypothetical protein